MGNYHRRKNSKQLKSYRDLDGIELYLTNFFEILRNISISGIMINLINISKLDNKYNSWQGNKGKANDANILE